MPNTHFPGSDTIHRHTLSNGITALIFENPAAESVVVEGLVRAGAIVEERSVAGLANFTAEMLMRGTERRSFEDIYEEIESAGATLGFDGGRHISEFSSHGLVEDLDMILDLLADSLRHPTFPEEQLEQVRGEISTGLQIRANDTRQMAALAFRELLYEGHPYGRSAEGYLDSVRAISRDEMAAFHRDYYGPQGMIITIVGAVGWDDALAKIEAVFGDWQTAQKPVPAAPPADRPLSTVTSRVTMAQKTQADVVLGVPGPLRAAPDYLEASMANTILGVFGMYGRLGKNVREEQGLAYYAFSSLQGSLGPAPWFVSTGVAPDKVEQAISSILYEIDRLQNEPIPAEELEDSQVFRTGSMPVGLETNHGLASVITDIELFDLGLDYLRQLSDKIMAMTPATVQAAAQKYLSTEQLAIAVAGPGEESNG